MSEAVREVEEEKRRSRHHSPPEPRRHDESPRASHGRHEHSGRDDYEDEENLRETSELSELTAMARRRLKNGCCRECMKAFSKNGKVPPRPVSPHRAVSARSRGSSDGPLFPQRDASFAGAAAATLSISVATSGRR